MCKWAEVSLNSFTARAVSELVYSLSAERPRENGERAQTIHPESKAVAPAFKQQFEDPLFLLMPFYQVSELHLKMMRGRNQAGGLGLVLTVVKG
jgi:hypothetical protein